MDGKEFIKNMIKYYIPSLISAMVGIFIIPVITSLFPSEEYGKIDLFYSMANTICILVMCGLDSAYFRFYCETPAGYNSHRLFKFCIAVGIINAVLVYIICINFFPEQASMYLFGEENSKMLKVLLIYVIGLLIFKFIGYEYRMVQNAKLYNYSQIVYILTNRIAFAVLAPISTLYVYSEWMMAISTFLAALCFLVQIERKRFQIESPKYLFNRATFEMFAFGIPLMPATLVVWLNNSIAKFIYSYMGDYSAVGTFSIATSIANLFSIVSSAFTTYWAPFIYKNYKTEQNFIKKIHEYVMLASIVLFAFMFLFQDVLYCFVGGEYKNSQNIFLLIMINPVLGLISETTCYGIMLEKKTKYNMYISINCCFINILITYITYHSLGLVGAAIGIMVSALLQFILKTLIGQKFYKMIEHPKRTIVGIIVIVLIALINIVVYVSLEYKIMIFLFGIIFALYIYKESIKDVPLFLKNKIKKS